MARKPGKKRQLKKPTVSQKETRERKARWAARTQKVIKKLEGIKENYLTSGIRGTPEGKKLLEDTLELCQQNLARLEKTKKRLKEKISLEEIKGINKTRAEQHIGFISGHERPWFEAKKDIERELKHYAPAPKEKKPKAKKAKPEKKMSLLTAMIKDAWNPRLTFEENCAYIASITGQGKNSIANIASVLDLKRKKRK